MVLHWLKVVEVVIWKIQKQSACERSSNPTYFLTLDQLQCEVGVLGRLMPLHHFWVAGCHYVCEKTFCLLHTCGIRMGQTIPCQCEQSQRNQGKETCTAESKASRVRVHLVLVHPDCTTGEISIVFCPAQRKLPSQVWITESEHTIIKSSHYQGCLLMSLLSWLVMIGFRRRSAWT